MKIYPTRRVSLSSLTVFFMFVYWSMNHSRSSYAYALC